MGVSIIKELTQAALALALLGLLAWNATVQIQLGSKDDDTDKKLPNEKIESALETAQEREKRSANTDAPKGSGVGAVYTRWGRKNCPRGSEMVYSGIAGSSRHNETGGSTEYICLTREPQYAKFTNTLEGTGKIYGVEFEVGNAAILENNNPAGRLQDADVTCAVCRANGKRSTMMIPGRLTCMLGWNMEYAGYLMTSHYGHRAQFSYACVDSTAKGGERGVKSDNGGLMYHIQGVCGSLSCPRFAQGRELTCVVCTK